MTKEEVKSKAVDLMIRIHDRESARDPEELSLRKEIHTMLSTIEFSCLMEAQWFVLDLARTLSKTINGYNQDEYNVLASRFRETVIGESDKVLSELIKEYA
jgi:hypothetical protein